MKKQQGITLIALVITIIVLLILAGVTIAAITSNESAPNKAVQARDENERGAAKDAATLLVAEKIQAYYEAKYVNMSTQAGNILEYLKGQPNQNGLGGDGVTTGEYTVVITDNGSDTTTGKISVSKGEKVLATGTVDANGVITWDPVVQPTGNVYGLFDAEGNQLASWEELVAAPYYLDIEKDYNYYNQIVNNNGENGNSMRYVLSQFPDGNKVTTVIIPSSYTQVGENGHSEKIASEDSVISDVEETIKVASTQKNITKIGNFAFAHCTSLTNITIPNNVTSIGNYVFDSCTGLTEITIPDSVTSIGEWAFINCTGLTEITIPGSVTSIGNYVFDSCTGLTEITIPDSVTSIGEHAFYNCTGLTEITIPDSVTSIGEYAFYNCTGLTEITIPDSVTSIENYAFYNCTGLTEITIPGSVTNIGSNAFAYCTGLTEITIPDSVTYIGSDAFAYCTGLTEITIPDSVQSIDEYAFGYCENLSTVEIQNSSCYIASTAFEGCSWEPESEGSM